MNTFLVLLLIAAMIATAQAKGDTGPSAGALKSNRMMQQRIFFQAIAILIVVLILFAAGRT